MKIKTNSMFYQVKKSITVIAIVFAAYGLQSCAGSPATPEEKEQISVMDSTEKVVKTAMLEIDSRSKTLEEAIAVTSELFPEADPVNALADSVTADYKDYGYGWTDNSFADRLKSKSTEEVTICHTPADGSATVSITVPKNSLQAYLAKGDKEGACKEAADNLSSDTYRNERKDFYSAIEKSRNDYYYGKSILDYGAAKAAAISSRFEHEKTGGLDAAQFSKKQVTVKKLQDAVSALQSSVTSAGELLAGK